MYCLSGKSQAHIYLFFGIVILSVHEKLSEVAGV
jgi:hypothetical protein